MTKNKYNYSYIYIKINMYIESCLSLQHCFDKNKLNEVYLRIYQYENEYVWLSPICYTF